MLRVNVIMLIAAFCAALGQILLRMGMRSNGPLESFAPQAFFAYLLQALSSPAVVAGTALNALFFLLLLVAMSWAEVTVALPLTATEYGIAAVLGIAILHEAVPPSRWAGIALITAGVILINLSAAPATR